MNYTEAKTIIKNFTQIVVTGPQRSGTRIASKIIAHDFGLNYIDEKIIKCYSLNAAKSALDNSVVQAPGLSAKCHLFPENVLIVFMCRMLTEIQASERRIKWDPKFAENEFLLYEDVGFKQINAPISNYKYLVWSRNQRPLIKKSVELEYHSLNLHPLWIPKNLRTDFKYNQTKI